ncbi:MAG: MoxR family ATPase [Oscillospiraceae bacterium]|nr:MoxR family ATPase [Oscillospiraceae bacterium]
MQVQALAQALKDNIRIAIKGKDEIIDKVIICVLCDAHILLEDVPGTGKTTLVKALAKSLGLNFSRVQFTPDLLPSDLTGMNIFDQKSGEFVFRPGPVFTNILLADEINRATPRTQSSLLECMEERTVSIDGVTRVLEEPFLVAATQNPIEIQGTFPLPEAQLDRFFMRLSVGYPDEQSEQEMLGSYVSANPLETMQSVVTKEDLLAAQEEVRRVKLADSIQTYILKIAAATRKSDKIRLGVSPRGSIALSRAAQAAAAMAGRDYVIPDDVKNAAPDVLCHRILCKAASHAQAAETEKILHQIINDTPAPQIG